MLIAAFLRGQFDLPAAVDKVLTTPILPVPRPHRQTRSLHSSAAALPPKKSSPLPEHLPHRRAHRASLVIEWPLDEDHEPPSNVHAECQRLGVGLLRIWEGDVEWLIDPVPTAPLPATLNEFITCILANRSTHSR